MVDIQSVLTLALSIAFPVLLGFAGARFTVGSVRDWYPSLRKPSWVPPNAAFPIAWTFLYASMGLASYRVAAVAGWLSRPLIAYYVQLAFNVAWSPLFFGAGWMDVALVVIVTMLVLVAAVVVPAFSAVDATAGALLVPYVAFMTFASTLNTRMLMLNPTEVCWPGMTRLLTGRKGVKGAKGGKRSLPPRLSPQEL
ncbi:hypothetical protein BU14_1552s0003 [Porphyra umbilicalis]|uniref:Tryptophan-rich sensory protein n=1 Tax=Porphyra umbilicalis TaxID=2786 RepID=A0A1X6NLQ0_PORUM|nr:hypothetical protein BU14_1552s0003 [Porphyra umbilicalis]|eukprot:OSX69396.1 hypothetical protein BU14_1552s0003 [Porphyra umbilicalis]